MGMRQKDKLQKISEEMLSIQLKIEKVLKEPPETAMTGRKLEVRLILAQAKNLLQKSEKQLENTEEKEYIKRNILTQDIMILQNQIKIMENFLKCLDMNQKRKVEALKEIEKQASNVFKEMLEGVNHVSK